MMLQYDPNGWVNPDHIKLVVKFNNQINFWVNGAYVDQSNYTAVHQDFEVSFCKGLGIDFKFEVKREDS